MTNQATSTTASGWLQEIRSTFLLAWPLIIAQLAQMALTTTDVVMMGWLGPQFLAGGTLATALLHPFQISGFGLVMATTPLIAQAIGARQPRQVRRIARQGLWVSIALCAFIIPILWQGERIHVALGQDPAIARLAGSYLRAAVWLLPAALMIIVLRGLVSAHGNTSVVLIITVVGIALNALGNYALMFGNFGFPRLELVGAGITSSVVSATMFLLLLGYVTGYGPTRRYAILKRLWKPDWARFATIVRLGVPIGLMMAAETGMFAITAILMGWLGTDELAAHAVALQLSALAFMVPLGLSHATTIRVGLAYGRGSPEGVDRAGWVSIGLATGFMCVTCLCFLLFPEFLVSLFFDPDLAKNRIPAALVISYLGVAALFQLFDGAQVATASALRGLNDTKTPMIIAIVGYWGVGLSVAWFLGFVADWRGMGVWFGLASGLAFTAIVLMGRFAIRKNPS